jgi:hypothetical protein
LRSDETIVRIAGSVAPLRKRSLISGLLQLEFDDALLFDSTFHIPPLGFHRRLDRHRLHGAEKLANDRGVDPQAAKREAPRQSEHLVWALAAINGLR